MLAKCRSQEKRLKIQIQVIRGTIRTWQVLVIYLTSINKISKINKMALVSTISTTLVIRIAVEVSKTKASSQMQRNI